MRNGPACAVIALSAIVLLSNARVCLAQNAQNPLDVNIDQIRRLGAINDEDQQRIQRWIEWEVDRLSGGDSSQMKPFLETIARQRDNSGNSAAFKAEFGRQLAAVAVARLQNAETKLWSAVGLARALKDWGTVDTVEGLLAGLKTTLPAVRFLSASGLADLIRGIAADNALRGRVITALQAAGVVEDDAVVLMSIYKALAYRNHSGEVLPAYLAILDAKLDGRREGNGPSTSPELPALQYLNAVKSQLNNQQRADVVARLAVLLRLEAEQLQVANLQFARKAELEETLWLLEELLADLSQQQAQNLVRNEIRNGSGPNAILQAVWQWVGHEQVQPEGLLNKAPWDVPVGAP